MVAIIAEALEAIAGLFSTSREEISKQKEELANEGALNDLCLLTIQKNLLPAISAYLKVIGSLIAIFTAMKNDAISI